MDNTELLKGLDLSSLEKLSPAEKKLVFSVLEEFAKEGKSELYDNLLLEDYEEIPVDIEEFVDNNYYLGNAWHDGQGNSKLYPYWRQELKKLFPNNLDTNVNNVILSGSRGRGKAQPLDSLVFTEDGYRKMGDLKVGDKVYGRDGNLYPILGIYPQGKKKIVEITFSDGTKTKCSDEHLWTVKDNNINKFVTITAKEIYENGIYKRKLGNGWTEKRYSLPKLEPLKYEHKEHLISPYMLGCLLGDGCFSQCVGMTTADEEIKNYFIEELNKQEYEIHNHTKNENDISFYIKNKNYTNSLDKNIYWEEIKRLGLEKHTSYDKFIPNEYLYSDINDRIELLQGLLDTDAECRKDGQISFASTSKKLVENVIWLVQSLGGLATNYKEISHKYHYINKKNNIDEIRDAANVYSVGIKLPKNIQPFKLTRKLERLNPNRIEPKRRIIDIKYLENKEECQCIYIGSEEHLYLTNDLIVTHNTEIAVLIAAYLLHRILCLKNPIEHFHLKSTEKIVFAFMNIKLALAEEIATTKFQNTIKQSPWFLAHGTLEGRTKKVWIPRKYINENGEEQEAIDIKIGSQPDDVIGLPIYFAFFDEISFIRNQDIDKQKEKANDMIDTAIGGMKTRFVHKGKNPTLLCLASSKRSDKSFLEEHMRKKLESEKENVYISDGSVWDVKPKGTYSEETFKVAVGSKFLASQIIPEDEDELTWRAKGYTKILDVPVDFKPDFIDDIDRALCDFAGISSSSITKYIKGEAVTELVTNAIQNPFQTEILEISNDPNDDRQYYNFFDLKKIDPKLKSKPLFIHLDMSVTGDMTGIAGVFIKGKRPSIDSLSQSKDLFYSLAFSVNIKAPKGRQISFDKNRNFIYWLKEQGFNIKGITSDTYQSYDTGQTLKAKGYPYEVLSVDRVDPSSHICIPYQYFQSTIYEKRLEIYEDKVLIAEITDLERNMNTGKVDHPDGGKKDVCDAVCGAVYNASKHAEEFAYDYGETNEQLLRLNSDDPYGEVHQLTVDLEDELKKMGPMLGQLEKFDRVHPSEADKGTTDYTLYGDIIIL